MIVTAKRDLPSSQAGPLMTALKAGGAKFTAIEIASDHVFDDRRIGLEYVVSRLALAGGKTSEIIDSTLNQPSNVSFPPIAAIRQAGSNRISLNRPVASRSECGL